MQRVRLRPTMAGDLDFVLALQARTSALASAPLWDRAQHEAATRFAGFRHVVVEGGAGLEPVGFAVLGGCLDPNGAVELRQLAVEQQRAGFGSAALRVLKRMAFGDLQAHRLWLAVRGLDAGALAWAEKEGFSTEGRLREAVRMENPRGETYDSLVILAMLQSEYGARRAQGLELFA